MPVDLTEFKNIINSVPEEIRAKSEECAKKIMALVEEYDVAGLIAVAVCGACLQNSMEEGDPE